MIQLFITISAEVTKLFFPRYTTPISHIFDVGLSFFFIRIVIKTFILAKSLSGVMRKSSKRRTP